MSALAYTKFGLPLGFGRRGGGAAWGGLGGSGDASNATGGLLAFFGGGGDCIDAGAGDKGGASEEAGEGGEDTFAGVGGGRFFEAFFFTAPKASWEHPANNRTAKNAARTTTRLAMVGPRCCRRPKWRS